MTSKSSSRIRNLSRLDLWPLQANETVILAIVVAFYLGVVVGWIGDLVTKGGAW